MNPVSLESGEARTPGTDDAGDDIWAESPSPSHRGQGGLLQPPGEETLSDLPIIRRQHMTDGYREGLSVGKSLVMQQGFDDGYPLGISIGWRVGQVLGIFEGYLACKSIHAVAGMRELVNKAYQHAKEELAVTKLLEGIDEVTLARSNQVPDAVERVLSEWEGTVLRIAQTPAETRRMMYEESGQGGPDEIGKLEEQQQQKQDDHSPDAA